jgi:hypothetical protein
MPPRKNQVTRPNAQELGDTKEDTQPEPVDIPVHGVVNPESMQLMTIIA